MAAIPSVPQSVVVEQLLLLVVPTERQDVQILSVPTPGHHRNLLQTIWPPTILQLLDTAKFTVECTKTLHLFTIVSCKP